MDIDLDAEIAKKKESTKSKSLQHKGGKKTAPKHGSREGRK
jgi:hypothetical protein